MNSPATHPLFWAGEVLVWTFIALCWVTDLGLLVSVPAALLGAVLLVWAVTGAVQSWKAART